MSKNHGKIFEQDIERSAKKQKIFFHRNKDIHIPFNVRQLLAKHNMILPVSRNKYDNFLFHKGYLFPLELKSTGQKSISFDEKIIKEHQIKYLKEATNYENIIPGFIFNFRCYDNQTFFVHINDFLTYKDVAKNEKEHTYKHKVNKSSISLDICKEIGIEIKNNKNKTRYFYNIKDFISEAVLKYT